MTDITPTKSDTKRQKLKTYDLGSHQMLNAMGESAIATVPMETLWKVLCKGNKACDESANPRRMDPAAPAQPIGDSTENQLGGP